ncbi:MULTISPECIES: enoyl-CoA hydratase [Paraburkholderia]|uniref:Enoyl-CoA hydratase n=1 Tax=Paraburkholderia madseniana TaxID=2599607 RepID=A0AAP5BJ71_9BURK|nr:MULTISPECIES: enoyl-CoA hydratase [Paraburkholderia]MCX4149973.1 enoyl-CoA hydratase [Paraburkholderia madseniana]MDN7152909.1 enoyl-CoA hydratase [Paraburkholderia sp. WS6]MDQ6411791.1 enoyl-CoA hydratase [Paraburkholderia madseniana]
MNASQYDGLKLQKQGHTAIVMLSNPPAHTWTTESLSALKALLSDLEADRDIYALVITGEGDKFFSAGADLKLFADGDMAVASTMARCFGEAFEALASFPGVTIAAINGYAMGGGLECALACDMRVAERHAVLALPEPSVGLLPCAGGTQWLAWTVGESWAKRMILLGEKVDADRGRDIGLIDEVVGFGQALEKAISMAELVGRQSPRAVAACKRLIQGARGGRPQQMLPAEREAFLGLFETEDQREGVAAFFAKRNPVWRNA